MTGRIINLDELRAHLNNAKDRLSLEKQNILDLHPLQECAREEYAFAYVRAERLAMRAINRRLTDISWLPMQLDPKAEIMGENRSSMKRWLTAAVVGKPDASEFGNDFVHALARCGLKSGWDHGETLRLAGRIAGLFRDLSCLIGLVYYCSWLSENNVEEIPVSDPDDLGVMAEDVATLIQSPEFYRVIRAKEQDVEKKKIASKRREAEAEKPPKSRGRPVLRVIENEHYFDPYMPEGAPA